MRVKAEVLCSFTIEYEDDNYDVRYTKENIEMSNVQDLMNYESNDSVQVIDVVSIKKM